MAKESSSRGRAVGGDESLGFEADSRPIRGGYELRVLGDSAEKLLLIRFYFGDSSRILDWDEVKKTELPASVAYVSDGTFESFCLLSRETPIQNEASGIVSR